MALLQLPVLQASGAGGALLEASINSSINNRRNIIRTSFLSSASHVGVGCDQFRFQQQFGGRGGRQSGNAAASSSSSSSCSVDPRRTHQGSNSKQNAYPSASSRSSDPRRTHQWSNSERQRDSEDLGYNDGDATIRSYSRKSEGDNFNSSQRGRQGRNDGDRSSGSRDGTGGWDGERSSGSRDGPRGWDGERSSGSRDGPRGWDGDRSSGSRDGPRGWDARGRGQGRGGAGRGVAGRGGGGGGRVSGRSSSSSRPSPLTQTFTPRQATSQFVSDRTVYKAPWEQGPSSSSSSSGSWRDTGERKLPQKNPLIERLKRMQEEIARDEAEDDDDNDEDSKGLGPADSERGFRDFDDEARYDGGRANSAMARIVERLSKIPGSRNIYRSGGTVGERLSDETSAGPKYGQPTFPAAGRGWSTPDNPVPTPAAPSSERFRPDTRFPWEREDGRGEAQPGEKFTRVKPPSLAELTLPEDELKRLRSLGILTRHRIKIGRLGVTNGIVEAMHNEWRNSEVVRVKCEGPPAQNMKRTHESLEERTGGLVVWRAGGACLIYRGKDYVPPPLRGVLDFSEQSTSSSVAESEESKAENESGFEEDSETEEIEEGVKEQTVEPKIIVPRVSSVYDPELEREMEDILSTLGPRYDDWTGMKPVPVDADLLVGPNFKFKKPFRQLAYGVKSTLSNLELTNLRRLGRPIPPHFVLGINRGLEGLAAAIVKLWEKSEIAKIAVKRGVQNTNHERMAEQLKRLTGGVLLSRDKYFIVLYRGKDFLPPSVAAALEERKAMTTALQEEEEKARLLPLSREVLDTSVERSIAGTLAETLEAKANWERLQNSEEHRNVAEEVRKVKRRDMTRRIQRKVSITMAKKHRAELELQKVEKRLRPAGPPVDRENITEEERYMFSKLGLKMHAFLLLGRRGVFDGTVENMHLHWKHRPLVKVIYKARDKVDLEQTARMLEYESGGILVATIPTNKGQAVIVYRGKNYQRPPELRPRTLLTKRQALKRSIEMQRQQALTKHLLTLEKEIDIMKADLSKLGEEDREDDEEHDKEDDDEDDEESHDPTASDSEYFQETNESMTSELKSLKADGEGIRDGSVGQSIKRQNPDIIYRADPLSRRERLILRQQALKEKKRAAHFNVGRSNVLSGLARAIRIHFRKHALVKVGVRGRAKGTPVEEILYQLEEATGGTLVSHEHSKVILYRGWPEGQVRPTEETGRWEELPPQLRSAMIAEVEADDDYLHESDWEESDNEDDDVDEEGFDEEDIESRATMDDSEADDDSFWGDSEEDDNEGYLRNELDIGLPEEEEEDEDDYDKDEEEPAGVENDKYYESRATIDDPKADDDSFWADFEEDDNEGNLENELEIGSPEGKEEHVRHEVAVNDAVLQ